MTQLSSDRRRGVRGLAARLAVVVVITLATAVGASAQDAPTGPDVTCTTAPRPAEELVDIWFDAAGATRPVAAASPVVERASDPVGGAPADASTATAIEAVAHEWIACTNAGDRLRALSLLTDAAVQWRGPAGASREEATAALAASTIPLAPEARISIGAAHTPRVFTDGMAGAIFPVVGFVAPGEGLSVFILFEQMEGIWRIAGTSRLLAPPPTAPVSDYRVLASFPHDPQAFTQGLVLIDGVLYEGTGERGESELRQVDLETGQVVQARPLDDELFGEGIAVLGDRIYQLTWQAGVGFVYDRETFELLETLTYAGEGWGLTTDGAHLIMSDGSDGLVFRDPDTFAALRSVRVQDGGLPVSNLNELEYIDGEVWANVWQTNRIVRIDPATGDVTGWLDMTGLLPADYPGAEDANVLNGIAYEADTGRLIITGKDWPALFEIELVPAE